MNSTVAAVEEALRSKTRLLRSSQMKRKVARVVVLRSLRWLAGAVSTMLGHHSTSGFVPSGVNLCSLSGSRTRYQTSRANTQPRSMRLTSLSCWQHSWHSLVSVTTFISFYLGFLRFSFSVGLKFPFSHYPFVLIFQTYVDYTKHKLYIFSVHVEHIFYTS